MPLNLKREEILSRIDDMIIYEKDYETILRLMRLLDSKMFTSILEEVILGNLYWSDFEDVLSDTPYSDILPDFIEKQAKLTKDIANIIEFRKTHNLNDDKIIDLKTNLGLFNDGDNTNYYLEELDNLRNNIIYSILNAEKTDNVIAQAAKVKLYNAIENWKAIYKTSFIVGDKLYSKSLATSIQMDKTTTPNVYINSEKTIKIDLNDRMLYLLTGNDITATAEIINNATIINGYSYYFDEMTFELWKINSSENVKNTSVSGGKIVYTSNSTSYTFEFINPNDILLSATEFIIPIYEEYHVLSAADREYMTINNIDEDEMIKLKAVAALIRGGGFKYGQTESE